MCSSFNLYKYTLDSLKSAIACAVMHKADPRGSISSISSVKEVVQKQFIELGQFSHSPQFAALVGMGEKFIRLLEGDAYVPIANLASDIESSINHLLSRIPEEQVRKVPLPKCDSLKITTLGLFVKSALITVKIPVTSLTPEEKIVVDEARKRKILAIESRARELLPYKELEGYTKLVDQLIFFSDLLSRSTTEFKQLEIVEKNIETAITAIIEKSTEDSKIETEELGSIPAILQDSMIQDELGRSLSARILQLEESIYLKPLLPLINNLFKRLSIVGHSYSKEQVDYILSVAILNPEDFLLLLLFEAVKNSEDLSTYGLLTPYTEIETILFQSLKHLTPSQLADYIAGKTPSLLIPEQDIELKKSIYSRVCSVSRAEFTKLMEYATRYYSPSSILLTTAILRTDDVDLKKKLLELLTKEKQETLDKIQAFIDAEEIEISNRLAINFTENDSAFLLFMETLPFIAARYLNKIKNISLAIINFYSEGIINEEECEQVITTLIRKIAQKSVEKAEESLRFIIEEEIFDKKIIRAAVISLVLEVGNKDVKNAITIALKSSAKKPALKALFECTAIKSTVEAVKAFKYVENIEDRKVCFLAFIKGIYWTAKDGKVELPTSIEDEEIKHGLTVALSEMAAMHPETEGSPQSETSSEDMSE